MLQVIDFDHEKSIWKKIKETVSLFLNTLPLSYDPKHDSVDEAK